MYQGYVPDGSCASCSPAEIGSTPRRDRSGSGSRSVATRVEIGPVPARDRSYSASRSVRFRLEIGRTPRRDRFSRFAGPDDAPSDARRRQWARLLGIFGWLAQFDLSGEFCSSSPLEADGRFVSVNDAVVVRRATVFDVGALVALRAEMFRVTGTAMTDGRWRSNAHRWFTERVKNPIYGIFVVQAGQDVVACAMGAVRDAAPSPEVPDGRDVLVSNVCTFPAHRGHGYGKRAFEAVMRWAVSTGIGRAELMATEAGRGMYEQTGFVTNRFAAMRADLRTY